MRFQVLEDEFDLPTRVGLSDGVGVEQVRVDVGQVEPILCAVGEPDPAISRRWRRRVRRVPA